MLDLFQSINQSSYPKDCQFIDRLNDNRNLTLYHSEARCGPMTYFRVKLKKEIAAEKGNNTTK
jgi:hypothetical protein